LFLSVPSKEKLIGPECCEINLISLFLLMQNKLTLL